MAPSIRFTLKNKRWLITSNTKRYYPVSNNLKKEFQPPLKFQLFIYEYKTYQHKTNSTKVFFLQKVDFCFIRYESKILLYQRRRFTRIDQVKKILLLFRNCVMCCAKELGFRLLYFHQLCFHIFPFLVDSKASPDHDPTPPSLETNRFFYIEVYHLKGFGKNIWEFVTIKIVRMLYLYIKSWVISINNNP